MSTAGLLTADACMRRSPAPYRGPAE
jgi:hypothetical protein